MGRETTGAPTKSASGHRKTYSVAFGKRPPRWTNQLRPAAYPLCAGLFLFVDRYEGRYHDVRLPLAMWRPAQRSDKRLAAGDRDRRSRDVARHRVGQHDVSGREFGRLTGPLHRNLLAEILDGIFR